MDRYAMSGIAFSAAKAGMEFSWCAAPDAGLPAPDLILYMGLSAEEAAKRGGFGQERYEKHEFQDAVRQQFLVVKGAMAGCKGSEWSDIDAAGTIEEVAQRIAAVTATVTARVANEPVRTLWEGAPMR
jgi:dTMP kinase